MLIISAWPCRAHDESYEIPKARLSPPQQTQGSGSGERIKLAPVVLDDGSELTVSAPREWLRLALEASKTLQGSHEQLSGIFGEIPQFRTSVQLMEEETFFLATGAPRWTNALYYKGQIILPIADSSKVDVENMARSIRHEYTHAAIHALSGGHCPGWIDEGLAQWAEGPTHPAIKRALANWMESNKRLIPLAMLTGGFTRLEQRKVPAAYAQSLYLTKELLTRFGFIKMKQYLSALRHGDSKERAFRSAFGIEEWQFEKLFEQTTNRLS